MTVKVSKFIKCKKKLRTKQNYKQILKNWLINKIKTNNKTLIIIIIIVERPVHWVCVDF